ncbi:glycoside hydrolase family 13 protein [Clostridium sp. BJN0001]|uniref:glycoside hydrolase family 13 protein n=1 Tax=Clostridium sp. BJN0001 TaxID=2930219 RepID=UPI001FD45E3E|nr:glycoside hydrolase family 13 protein [Clostridium sp. BJN0001]
MKNIEAIHDSYNTIYRKPFGAAIEGTKVKLSIDINMDILAAIEIIDPDGRKTNIGMNKRKLKNGFFRYYVDIDTKDKIGIMKYYFILIDRYDRIYYGNNKNMCGGIGEMYESNPDAYQITVYKEFNVPEWYKSGVVYQLFIDRFFNGNKDGRVNSPKKNSFIYGNWDDTPMSITDNNGNVLRWDFYGGNVKGIIEKLGYLKELGITVLNLSPIFKSPSCDKYDVADYDKIDEMLGNEEDIKELCTKASENGIKVVLDIALSYTSSDSIYFNKLDNYDEIGAYQSKESKYIDWYKFHNYPFQYDCWWGNQNRPNINTKSEKYLDYILYSKDSVFSRCLNFGINGFKLILTDELDDNFIKIINEKAKGERKDFILAGDVWEDASKVISYSKRREYLLGCEIDSVTNYVLRDVLINFVKGYIDAETVKNRIMSIKENYPKESFYSCLNVLTTQDTDRIINIVDNNYNMLSLLIVMQFTLPGIPVLYYADEVSEISDKNRKSFPWKRKNKGNVEFYKKIIAFRNHSESLKKGDIDFLDSYDNILAYKRTFMDESVLIIVNTSNQQKVFKTMQLKGEYQDLFYPEKTYKFNTKYTPVSIGSYDFKVLYNKNI